MATLPAAQSDFELESKRKEDSSWHPCKVSLSSVGDGLFVDFGQDSGVEFLDKEEVLTQLRFRSVPLKGDDCSSIKESEHVLAANNSGLGSLFYDAKVEKVLRVRHYRGPCRCKFTIKWLHQDFEDGITVPSSSIMKLAMKSITVYPTVAVLLESEKHVKSSGASPFLIEDINYDVDLSNLLEKQIKDISKSADALEKEITKETRLRIEHYSAGNSIYKKGSCKLVAAAKISIPCVKVPCDQSPVRRITRRSSNLQVAAEVEDPPVITSSVEELSENRSHLSPLAACAALASRVQITTTGVAIDGTSLFNNNMVNMKDKASSDILATPFPVVSESVEMVKSLISTQRSTSPKSQLAGLSSGMLNQEWKNEDKTSEFSNSSAEDRNLEVIFSSTRTGTRRRSKLNQPASSAIRNDSGIANDNIQIKNCADDLKLETSTGGKRLTRSALRREKESLATESLEKSSHITAENYSEANLAVNESNGCEISNNNIQMKTSADDLKLRASTNRKRFTRSSVQQETLEAKCRSTHGTESNYSEGKGDISKKDSCTVKRKKTVSSSLDAESDILGGRKSKEQASTAVQTNEQTAGGGLGNVDILGQKKKFISSDKQSQQDSVHNFLPRTRSQAKSQHSRNMGTRKN
ncbi:uncharacterized protein LOC110667242 isoform X2 [Hevea brasiliensis]|uniref:uncharacterized protein LOC110667242 isoform X2 n=1 Tax=Hevea brasiliensis TaxID=3981 RepID=UPI0025FA802D|nr:uncharacterized protein LOC110667242 isoform X2 [Hevea brasiliensis]